MTDFQPLDEECGLGLLTIVCDGVCDGFLPGTLGPLVLLAVENVGQTTSLDEEPVPVEGGGREIAGVVEKDVDEKRIDDDSCKRGFPMSC